MLCSSLTDRQNCRKSMERYIEHQVQASPSRTTSPCISINSSQANEATSANTSNLPPRLNIVVHDLELLSPQLPPADRGKPSNAPSAVFGNIDSMTPGQASLFDMLLSLAHPSDECPNISVLKPHPSVQANTTRQPLEMEVEDNSVDGNSPEHPGAPVNTLPFILNAYASWAIQMMFDPLRIIQIGRRYVLRHYAASVSARWKLKLVSDFAWTAAGSTAYGLDDLPSFMTFQTRMCQQFLTVTCTKESREILDQHTASEIFAFAHELLSIAFKYLPLSNLLSLMQLGAPVFRRACPGAREELVHLPSLLLQKDLSLRYYSTFDILMSVIMNRPMFFRYNVSFTPDLPESKMHIQDYFGMQWFYGVPDRLVVTLARINALREDYGDCVDATIIRELELEIGSFRPVLGTSDEPILVVSRLIVQECWRQAAFIYLYMGLCGAHSLDARVRLAQARFMELFQGVKPGRNPDVFLIFPIVMLGCGMTSDWHARALPAYNAGHSSVQ
ncbi:hypothetical protein OPQ81_010770 [Rhizoctonia solani]|nr:hypothetical protein OPQ81_010770 [Rhizoctonia solani]